MSNIDPASTASPDGGATVGPSGTFDGTASEFEPQRDPFSDLPDADGDGDAEVPVVQSFEEIVERRQAAESLAREEAAAAREAELAEQAAAEAEAAAREQAAETGEPVHIGSGTHDGEPVEIFAMPDGSTYMVSYDGDEAEVVAVAFPSDPIYMGQVYSTDGTLDVYQLYDGSQVVVQDGQLVGPLDEVEHATVAVDVSVAAVMGIPPDIADDVSEIYTVPMGPPSYDTYVVDAATGDVVGELDTGTDYSAEVLHAGGEAMDDYATYDPPGADYTVHVDDGEVINIVPNPEEPEWSFLGIVEYYEDGTYSVDLAIVEFEVDWEGPEKSVSVGVDLFFFEVGAGVEWDSDGNWSFEAYAGVDFGAFEYGGSLELEWEDGEFSAALDGYVGVQLGAFEAGVEGGIGVVIGEDGVEASFDVTGTARGSLFGSEIDVELDASIDVGPGGVEGRFGANGEFSTTMFGGFEAGASFDTEGGFDSWSGSGDDAGDAGFEGVDTSWTDELTDDSADFGDPDAPTEVDRGDRAAHVERVRSEDATEAEPDVRPLRDETRAVFEPNDDPVVDLPQVDRAVDADRLVSSDGDDADGFDDAAVLNEPVRAPRPDGAQTEVSAVADAPPDLLDDVVAPRLDDLDGAPRDVSGESSDVAGISRADDHARARPDRAGEPRDGSDEPEPVPPPQPAAAPLVDLVDVVATPVAEPVEAPAVDVVEPDAAPVADVAEPDAAPLADVVEPVAAPAEPVAPPALEPVEIEPTPPPPPEPMADIPTDPVDDPLDDSI